MLLIGLAPSQESEFFEIGRPAPSSVESNLGDGEDFEDFDEEDFDDDFDDDFEEEDDDFDYGAQELDGDLDVDDDEDAGFDKEE